MTTLIAAIEAPVHVQIDANDEKIKDEKIINEKFEEKIALEAVYTFVRYNKLNCWGKFNIQELLPNNVNEDTTSSDTDDYDVKSVTIAINSEKWKSIKPVQRYYRNRHRLSLKTGWTDIVNEELHATLATQFASTKGAELVQQLRAVLESLFDIGLWPITTMCDQANCEVDITEGTSSTLGELLTQLRQLAA
ncbi:hypothetical protein CBL_10072 [Carabus blaptoides fortunei]